MGGGVTTGQIGDIRIGGNATNFTAFALETDLFTFPSADPTTGPQVSNFFIGGETNNVILVAPAGSRNVSFGRGMDNIYINTAFIQNLQANRGAIGSAVTVKRTIGNMVIGGDVINIVHPVGVRSGALRRGQHSGHDAPGPDHSRRRSLQRRGAADDREPDLNTP